MGMWNWLGRKTFKLLGWKLVGVIPEDVRKCVITVAPHTSMADFLLGRLAYCFLDRNVKYLIKKELFNIPLLRGLLLRLGGIPVDRSGRNNIVNQAAALFTKYDDLNIILAPEGTRKRVNNWKKGFYYIALKAEVPVVLGFLDYKKKELGFGPMIYLTGNYEEDWKKMEAFYRGINAKYPERYNLSN
ncbi:MAG: 1-acyl-sn-glycerol-3-phosphate acyltransferase [Bacteroidales bacterium]|nr:1-acyl-sn-glycerol-3-phosphate acyltransferase [Bacteroidales bacterium]